MTSFMESLRKGLDRAGFEADKLMRYNRVRSEAARIHGQAHDKLATLGERVLAQYQAGSLHDAELETLAREILDLQERSRQKEDEATAIQAEAWVEPPDPTPAPSASAPPPPPAYTPPAPPSPPPAAYTSPAPYTPSQPATPRQLDDQGTHRMPMPDHPTYCPVCGASLRPQAAFCAACGVRL